MVERLNLDRDTEPAVTIYWTLTETCHHCKAVIDVQTGISDELRNSIIMALSDKQIGIDFNWTLEE